MALLQLIDLATIKILMLSCRRVRNVGWNIPVGRSAVVEVYPSLWCHSLACERRSADQHDAYTAAAWMRHAGFINPPLSLVEPAVAQTEGWILGIK